jgi:hypothetical protein
LPFASFDYIRGALFAIYMRCSYTVIYKYFIKVNILILTMENSHKNIQAKKLYEVVLTNGT